MSPCAAFGYRDLRMFFIPLFGAAVTGRNYNVPGWKKAIVSLAGPLPGILLGVALGGVALALGTRWLMEAAGLMILLNGFNLLPFLPLDGGWVAHAILFSRRPWLDAGFRILAAVALILGGLALGTRMLPLIGAFLLFGVPLAFRVARVAAAVRREDLPTDAACDKIPAETACRIIDALRGSVPKGVGDKQLASLTLQVYETANARPPGWLATLAFAAVHAGSFLLAIVAPVALLFASGFGWRHPGERTAAEPRHALNVELIRSFPSPEAGLSPGDAHVTVIATFPTAEAAGGAVPSIASQLPGPHRLKLFGQTLILELPAGTDPIARGMCRPASVAESGGVCQLPHLGDGIRPRMRRAGRERGRSNRIGGPAVFLDTIELARHSSVVAGVGVVSAAVHRPQHVRTALSRTGPAERPGPAATGRADGRSARCFGPGLREAAW